VSDDEILAKFSGIANFSQWWTTWSAEKRGYFLQLARSAHEAGLDVYATVSANGGLNDLRIGRKESAGNGRVVANVWAANGDIRFRWNNGTADAGLDGDILHRFASLDSLQPGNGWKYQLAPPADSARDGRWPSDYVLEAPSETDDNRAARPPLKPASSGKGRLESDSALKAQLDAALADALTSEVVQDWHGRLAAFFLEVKAAVPSSMRDVAFLRKLWDDNPVSATGMGSVKMSPALENAAFVEWFATAIAQPLPHDDGLAEAHLISLYDQLKEKLKALCGRTPILKLNRVLCAIYPEHFTTIADIGALIFLHREMGGRPNDHAVRAHKAIRRKVDAALGASENNDALEVVKRVCLPWALYERISDEPNVEHVPTKNEIASQLKPQPAALRRKGLTSMKGHFQTLLGYLPELSEGMTRDEFADLIQQANPELAKSSLSTIISVVSREHDLCKLGGDVYKLTPRGINLLRTQEPDELADHLLTRILGVDHVVHALARSPKSKIQLMDLLRQANPGWTSNFGPSSILSWLTSFGVTEVNREKKLTLTERGRRWADMVTWTPAGLAPDLLDPSEEVEEKSPISLQLPLFPVFWERLADSVAGKLVVKRTLVGQLHSGLWSHPVRHFAVLTGISGSGKTQLAQKYAHALCGVGENDQEESRVRIIPVQPGWYDPSPLLGYVNPIQESSYRSAPFLDLLLRAAADPERPYVAILDEMNLSHPEQYLAPVLSVMETHGWLDLHQLADSGVPIPGRVRYPANLAIIGTLNMDETTHGLSDKVLDRAYTLEFWDINVEDFPGWKSTTLAPELREMTRSVLISLSKALAPVRLHFGYRTVDDVLSCLAFYGTYETGDASALDDVLYAKVLPKLRGETSMKFQQALQDARAIFIEYQLSRCSGKVESMQADLLASGSARFWR
jgi:5-methylcytosine-specific restriction protein B